MKHKKSIKINIKMILLLIVVAVIIVVGYKTYKSNLNEITVVSKIDDYNYKLESNASRIYKKYFKELEAELEDNMIDENNYATIVVKLFLIDFYTLSNKVSNQDVGGLQYIHSAYQDNFRLKATDTIYKYVKSNIYNNRHQDLPTVKDVKIKNIEQTTYKYNDITDEGAYKVDADITYKKDLGYTKSVSLILIHEDIRLSIVEITEN